MFNVKKPRDTFRKMLAELNALDKRWDEAPCNAPLLVWETDRIDVEQLIGDIRRSVALYWKANFAGDPRKVEG